MLFSLCSSYLKKDSYKMNLPVNGSAPPLTASDVSLDVDTPGT